MNTSRLLLILISISLFSCQKTAINEDESTNEELVYSYKETMANRETDYYIVLKPDGTIDTENTTVDCAPPAKDCLPTLDVSANLINEYNAFTDSLAANNHQDFFTTAAADSLWPNLSSDIETALTDQSNVLVEVEVVSGQPYYFLVDSSANLASLDATSLHYVLPVEE